MIEIILWLALAVLMYFAGRVDIRAEIQDWHRVGYNNGFADAVALAKRGMFDWQKTPPAQAGKGEL